MTAPATTPPSESVAPTAVSAPTGWEKLVADGDVQFSPVAIPKPTPREPTWFSEAMEDLFQLLADLLGPVGEALAASWWWLQWVVAGVVVLFALILLVRLVQPLVTGGQFGKRKADKFA
jgi:hypothetical protein